MPYTMEQIQTEGALCFENVVYGMKHYAHRIESYSAQKAEEALRNMWISKSTHRAYVDFYYYILEEDARAAVDSVLTKEEQAYLAKKKEKLFSEITIEEMKKRKAVVFPLDEQLLKIAVKLNEKEMLFSTFYFVGNETSTWWGNYNREYIVFTQFPLQSLQ